MLLTVKFFYFSYRPISEETGRRGVFPPPNFDTKIYSI
jgi:hypothetical protein